MSYIGDFAIGVTFDTKFTSINPSSGLPITLAGSPVISAYVDNNQTQITAGITLTADFDNVTGLNNVHVVATVGNGYASGGNYQLVITTGTVGGGSIAGYVVAEFSIGARAAATATADIQSRLPAALTANGNMKSSLVEILTTALTETTGLLAGGFKKFFNIVAPAATMDHGVLVDTATTSINLTNAPTVGDFTGDMKTSLSAATPAVTVSDKTGFALTAAYDPAKTAAQAGNAMALTSGERNSIAAALLDLANGIETGITLRQAQRLELAALAGKLSGAATTTVVIRAADDSKDRITATVDADGNRSAVTLDGT